MKSWKKDFGNKDQKNDVQHRKSKTKLKFQLYSGMQPKDLFGPHEASVQINVMLSVREKPGD